MLKILLLIAGCIGMSVANVIAQDVLYFSDGTKQMCQITAVDEQKISYKNVDNFNGPTYTKANSQLLLAFRDDGKYLVLGNRSLINSAETNGFLKNLANRAYDILIMKNDEVISGYILSVEGEKFNYRNINDATGPVASIDKGDVAAIIYKNGKHQLYVSTTEAVEKLASVKSKVDKLTTPSSAEQGGQTVLSSNTLDTATTGTDIKELSKADLERFQFKAKEKTDRFGTYIAMIADKETARDEANKSIDAACGLFLSDTSRVWVSNVNDGTTEKRFVREYLKLLRLLPYDEVIVTWTDVSFVSDLRKGADGNYHGNITIQQVFEGYVDGKPIYRDVTEKRVEVVLKMYEKLKEGEKVELWDVFLTNVAVEKTTK
ncbi:hypothetical protein GCM10023188_36350 [Pontibacter saemangeumensis]|uniref:SnoaL-like domain-containing protein n=1 Tax=Pontibacter saemangeumensis TaxID=1084525 RepID=A0ABP8LXP6_9BACT